MDLWESIVVLDRSQPKGDVSNIRYSVIDLDLLLSMRQRSDGFGDGAHGYFLW